MDISNEYSKGLILIFIVTTAGIYPQYHAPIYAATKAAVVHLTRSLKNLQKDFNIRVVAVCPTYTVTPLITTHGPDVRYHNTPSMCHLRLIMLLL